MLENKKIAITIGDVNGIGPEIILKALHSLLSEGKINKQQVVLIGSKIVFEQASKDFSVSLPADIEIIDIPFDLKYLRYGEISQEAGELAYRALEKACMMAKNSQISSIVTAPLSKEAINLSGHHYSGQTEILEKFLAVDDQQAEMLFVSGDFRVLLLTRHIALNEVRDHLTREKIIKTVKVLNESLIEKFGVVSPKIAMCGLNPHCGENGLMGDEEIDVIIPAIKELAAFQVNLKGPYPADTLFVKAAKSIVKNENQPFDCYVACYHDQGLIPIKVLAMDKTVNTTIGLKVLRTSPAHGTAFDIAGKNIANFESMKHAIINA